MKKKILYLVLLASLMLSACSGGYPETVQLTVVPTIQVTEPVEVVAVAATQEQPIQAGNQANEGNGTPPAEAIAACSGKVENDTCSFIDKNGDHSGICKMGADVLACAPDRGTNPGVNAGNPQSRADGQQGGNNSLDGNGNSYNTEQAISDKAQGMTIAFDAMAFLTGDLGADSFFPPGKVADFWGFQYLRDNDPSQMGHAGDFLTSAAMNMLNVLSPDQRSQLIDLAESQVGDISEYGYRRFVLMQAFQNLIDGNLPVGTTGLNKEAVIAYSGDLYVLDGAISYERAQVYGGMLNSLDPTQKAYLDSMIGKGMLEWPDVEEPDDMHSLDRKVKVAVMTYAADMFSWYAGSVDADVYFCPERHGTYFGSFYLKDIKAMGDPTYAIPTDMTGNLGEDLLTELNPDQASLITSLVDIQRPSLLGIVATREQVAIELRKFLAGETPDMDTVLALMQRYGELDGEIIYNLAVNFTAVSQSLSVEQRTSIDAMRTELLGDLSLPTGAYLYSDPIPMPEIPSSDFLFE